MVTIKDIAERTGLSTCTVSWALRGVGQVGAATRGRVLAVAKEMGYQANSPAAMLAKQRHRRQSADRRIPVAVLGTSAKTGLVEEGFEGAAEELGLETQKVDALAMRGNAANPLRSLWHRGVRGLFLLPYTLGRPEETLAQWGWSDFSVVKNTRSMPSLRFTAVRLSAFDFMLRILREVAAAGHRRIGVVLTDSDSQTDDLSRLGAVLAFRERLLPAGGVVEYHLAGPATVQDAATRERAMRWVRKLHPTAVVVFPFSWYYGLVEAGFEIPQKLSVATPIRYEVPGLPLIAGCAAPDREIGRRAAERLYKLIQTGETGFASQTTEEVIEPFWAGSETLAAPGKPSE